jgi:glycosyltransferase involved in cell wall biosynthesis
MNVTVTIGMPVYNAASTIRAALDSLLSQTHRDFVLIISDNASNDATEMICREYVERDRRIRYRRQSINLGGAMNFRYVLSEAHTPYFTWAAADDLWAPRFIEQTVSFLEAHSDYVCCQSRVLLTVKGRPSHYSTGTYALSGNWSDNVVKFLSKSGDCSRFYGLFRTDVLQAVFPRRAFFAFDWAVSIATLKFGRHAELREILMIRDASPVSNYEQQLLKDHQFFLWRMFPILFMSLYCFRHQYIPRAFRSFWALLRLNLYMASTIGHYRSVRAGLRFMWAVARYIRDFKDWLAVAGPTARTSTPNDGSRQLPMGGWRMPRPLDGNSPQLSVIIVASNIIDSTLALIDSVTDAQINMALEIIICDLGRGDITPLLWKTADNIICIRCDPSLTYAAAANMGIKAARASIIGFFDQKALREPNTIAELLEAMTDSEVAFGLRAAMGTRCYPAGTSVDKDAAVNFYSYAYLVHRELFVKLGEFDETLATFEMAQADLGLRARAAGEQISFLPRCKGCGG